MKQTKLDYINGLKGIGAGIVYLCHFVFAFYYGMYSLEPTDLSLYEKDDIEHVGWYYIPIEEGKSVWMEPYYNKNLDVYMISYVIPVYKNGDLLGVVGMDINFEYIIKEVDSIRTYETGHAFITNAACEILYSRHHESGAPVSTMGGDLESLNSSSLPEEKKLYSYRY